MSLRDQLLLYAVTDSVWLKKSPQGFNTLERQVEEAIIGGVTIVQVREKNCSTEVFSGIAGNVKTVTDRYKVPLIVNDDIDTALAVDATGVHVGQKDANARFVRQRIGAGKILGVSVETVEQAHKAVADGADYLGVGTIFPTLSKSDAEAVSIRTLKEICSSVPLPVVAIGGITSYNIEKLSGSGIAGIAVISAIFAQGANIRAASADIKLQAKKHLLC